MKADCKVNSKTSKHKTDWRESRLLTDRHVVLDDKRRNILESVLRKPKLFEHNPTTHRVLNETYLIYYGIHFM